MAPWLMMVSWGQSTRVPTYWNDVIPPFPRLSAHLPKAPGSAQASRISFPDTSNAAGTARSSPSAGDFRPTLSFPTFGILPD